MLQLFATNIIQNSKDIADSINNNGTESTLIAVGIAIIVGIFAVFFFSYRKQTNNTNAQLNKLLNHILEQDDREQKVNKAVESINSVVKTCMPKNEDILGMFMQFNSVFKEECKFIMSSTNAIRVCVYVFHNGTTSSHGLPFFKMSCISEWFQKSCGIGPQAIAHCNIPLFMLCNMTKDIYDNGVVVKQFGEDESLYDPEYEIFIRSNGKDTKCTILLAIYDDNNMIMGFVRADYSTNLEEEQSEKYIKKIRTRLSTLASIMQFNKHDESTNNE